MRNRRENNAKGGADAQLGEKQWMWRHLRPERATTSFQMRHSQGMTASFTRHDVSHCSFDVVVIIELCISAAYRISSSDSSLLTNVWLLTINVTEARLNLNYIRQIVIILAHFHYTSQAARGYYEIKAAHNHEARKALDDPSLNIKCWVKMKKILMSWKNTAMYA
jgi:hypothetical protein